MNARTMFSRVMRSERSYRPVVQDIAELVLEIPVSKPERREDAPARRAPRKNEERLVPDQGPTGDLVPDGWGGVDLV